MIYTAQCVYNAFDAGSIYYLGKWEGVGPWKLRVFWVLWNGIEPIGRAIWGPKNSTEQLRNQQRHIKCIIYACGTYLVFNNNEIGQPEDPSLIHEIERIHNYGPTKSFKLLGVLFDEYLSFDAHITHLCTKISKSLFCINRIKNFVNQDTRKTLYCAMVHSHLVYCINVYGCAKSTSLNKLR